MAKANSSEGIDLVFSQIAGEKTKRNVSRLVCHVHTKNAHEQKAFELSAITDLPACHLSRPTYFPSFSAQYLSPLSGACRLSFTTHASSSIREGDRALEILVGIAVTGGLQGGGGSSEGMSSRGEDYSGIAHLSCVRNVYLGEYRVIDRRPMHLRTLALERALFCSVFFFLNLHTYSFVDSDGWLGFKCGMCLPDLE